MYTSFAILAFASLIPANIPPASNWESDYRLARQAGEKQQKPLAVFVGTGTVNWQQLTREGQLDPQVQKILAQQYVRVFIDVKTEYGRKCAELFGLSEKNGLIISDRTGDLQAFRHDGLLSAKDLARQLVRFGNPEHVVRTTETNYAPPAVQQVAPISYQNPYAQQCLT